MSEALLLSITSYALNAAWQAAAITLAAAAIERWMGRTAPDSQHWFWLCACALAVLVPLAATDFASMERLAGEAEGAAAGVAAQTGGAWAVERARWQLPVAELLQWLAAAMIAGGALVSLARLGRGSLTLLALRRRALSVPDRVSEIAAQCASGLGLKRSVEILAVEGLAGPVTYGFMRAVVLIPAEFCRNADDDLLPAVFGHELAHARRNDFLLNTLCEAALLPLAWHPAAGLLRKRLAVTREAACDEMVATMLDDRKRYARSLLRIAANSLSPSPGLGMSDGGELEQRIRSLLSLPPRTAWHRIAGSAVSILLTGILASCGMIQAVAPPFKVEPKSLAGTWEGSSMGYQFRVSFQDRGQAVSGRVDMEKEVKAREARIVFDKLGDPPTVVVPPPPPPPPPPGMARWNRPETGEFGTTVPGKGGIAFRVSQTEYLMTFDASGSARLKARQADGGLPEINVALRKKSLTN